MQFISRHSNLRLREARHNGELKVTAADGRHSITRSEIILDHRSRMHRATNRVTILSLSRFVEMAKL